MITTKQQLINNYVMSELNMNSYDKIIDDYSLILYYNSIFSYLCIKQLLLPFTSF